MTTELWLGSQQAKSWQGNRDAGARMARPPS